MVNFRLKFTKQATKDLEYLKLSNFSEKTRKLVDIIK